MIELKCSPEFFEDMFTPRTTPWVCTKGLPDNAELVSIDFDPSSDCFILVFDDGHTTTTQGTVEFKVPTPVDSSGWASS